MDFLKRSPGLSGELRKKALKDNNVEASSTGAKHVFAAGGRGEGEAFQTAPAAGIRRVRTSPFLSLDSDAFDCLRVADEWISYYDKVSA
jgi:hypothetical protein